MHPAFSVIFLTTLIGVGQGLFLALITGQSYSAVELLPSQDSTSFYGIGGALALIFLVAGLIASIFHLGRPERAWRSATRWRSSWLSREVIILPLVMLLVFVYAVMHLFSLDTVLFTSAKGASLNVTLIIGALGAVATFLLFLCTGMIYASIKFLQEWASSLTVINYLLLGTASGFLLATAFAAVTAPGLMSFYGIWTTIILTSAFITRMASLLRNSRIKYKSSIQTAIGIRHEKIQQKSMGMMGGAMNTRDFFHHKTTTIMNSVRWIFIVLTFLVPIILLWKGMNDASVNILISAFVVQYIGLIFERWYFFAQASHPQNLYYQTK
ncbi:Anaerobic dimethyl sulfoxide reductase chain C, anchor subunit [hydrothermal vent metagenome]|uniref:Anaerobic dimethyl sulfoxide reductase chain C, anchor subunit n=1 Tax=hydrothermal vent metagenome TaxID=652676 RepID=A0A3B1AVB3_9ZZZZ